jgi:hypothetical protein
LPHPFQVRDDQSRPDDRHSDSSKNRVSGGAGGVSPLGWVTRWSRMGVGGVGCCPGRAPGAQAGAARASSQARRVKL